MPSTPRIVRAVPRGSISRPMHGIPVIAVLRWHVGQATEVPALAVAWTAEAVEIAWQVPSTGEMRSDWIPAADVRRPAGAGPGSDRQPPPPRRTPGRHPQG